MSNALLGGFDPSKIGPLIACLLATGLSLGGCASDTKRVTPVASGAAERQSGWAGQEAVKQAIALLNAGDPIAARKLLLKVLNKEPGDAIARKLIDQIDKDPKVLLGSKSFPYVVKQADSFSQLAQTFLGDPMLFYALARYNGVIAAGQAPVGRNILIPGTAPVVRKAPTPPLTGPKPASKSVNADPAPAVQKPAAPASNPRRGARLRGQALAAMNSGAIDRAVVLLRQALSADPNSSLIKSDLNRALRIQGGVRRP